MVMDSGKGVYYGRGAEETPSDYYNSDEDVDNYDDDVEMVEEDEDEESGYDTVAEDDGPRKQEQNYVVLEESTIRQRQEKAIAEVSSVLMVSRAAATVLLLHYNWRVCEVQDAWFADEEGVRESAGLLEKPVVEHQKDSEELTCKICLESCSYSVMRWAACGHPFCDECWETYISVSVQDGPGCLKLRCPSPSCGAAVDRDMIDSLTSERDKERYSRFLMRSYIETNKKSKWCPAPGCGYAVEFNGEGAVDYDVCCLCTNKFCWNCTEEAHRPVDCDIVAKWNMKKATDAENVSWILKRTRPCPKCRRPIQKNAGCMHMTCGSPCNHQFCWMCLKPWAQHDFSDVIPRCSGEDDEERVRKANSMEEKAKVFLERYAHYYERWADNESKGKIALENLQKTKTESLKTLSDFFSEPESQFRFIAEAWEQIMEGRRVLKWTYTYGHHLAEEQKDNKALLFEYLQGEAELRLQNLYRCGGMNIDQLLTMKGTIQEINSFRIELTELTRVTRNYFENLVRALENGLEDISPGMATSSRRSSSKGKGVKQTKETSRPKRSRKSRGKRRQQH